MKYLSVNSLNDFEFHDSEMELINYDNNDLIVAAKYLNIHKGTKQNSSAFDMEISLAKINFKGFSVKSFEPGREWKTDKNGNHYTDEPLVIFRDKDAEARIISELKRGICVYDLGVFDNELYYMDAMGDEPFFTTQFSFDAVTIEWDEYRKKAWYEEGYWKNSK